MVVKASKKAVKKAVAKEVAKKAAPKKDAKPKLLSGGNPQIAKGYGDVPVQAYIDAIPGWKRDIGRRVDALIVRAAPKVQKAVKWNSPFYGMDDKHWFMSFHCFAKYIKVAFFRGASLRPPPPETSKQEHVRYFHIHEHDVLDEDQFHQVGEAGEQAAGREDVSGRSWKSCCGIRVPSDAIRASRRGSRNVPIQCAGVLVMPGDVLVGDPSGVIVVPQALAADVADKGFETDMRDAFSRMKVLEGVSVDAVFPLTPAYQPEYEAWRKQQPA